MSPVLTQFKGYRLVIAGLMASICLSMAMCDSLKSDRSQSRIVHPRGLQFAGSANCENCHQQIFDSHLLTAHYLTSQPADIKNIKGSFDSSRNILSLNNRLKIIMKKKPTGFFQVGFVDGWEVNSKPMDIVIGAGRKGQTYLYWQENELFQLPVSYYTPLDTWCNSPGYPTDQILFNRNIPARCLECHGTYFKSENKKGVEVFDKSKMMYGVDCERCHGPAAKHVSFHLEHPEEKKAQYIVNPAGLTRKQKLDNCALCHSGIRKNIKPPFSFIVGDNLEDYSLPDYSADSIAALDVHGNQYGLLSASACFKNSNMDCSSCHDVHKKEPDDMKLFSLRCMNCHSPDKNNFCTQHEVPGLTLSNNCIDCHLPLLPSSQVLFQVVGKSDPAPYFVRTHLIKTYEEDVKKYLKGINSMVR